MVADTTTLLDKESRKSLQFLQGLKGTHLIIPRMGNESGLHISFALPEYNSYCTIDPNDYECFYWNQLYGNWIA